MAKSSVRRDSCYILKMGTHELLGSSFPTTLCQLLQYNDVGSFCGATTRNYRVFLSIWMETGEFTCACFETLYCQNMSTPSHYYRRMRLMRRTWVWVRVRPFQSRSTKPKRKLKRELWKPVEAAAAVRTRRQSLTNLSDGSHRAAAIRNNQQIQSKT